MDATEITEIEMLRSQIKRLKTQNQGLLEETERLRSASDLREKALSDLQSELHVLQSEKENMETKVSKIVLDLAMRNQELKDEVERDGFRKELDLKNEEADRLLLDLQELETTSQEDQMELRKVKAERARLLEEKERWDDGVGKIAEDNTTLIHMVLTSQEEQMNRMAATLEAFEKKVLEMVRRTREIVDSPHAPTGWDEGETSEEKDDDEIGNVVMVMASPVEQELKKIEAAAAAMGARKAKVEKAVKANTAAAAEEARKEVAAKAAATAARPRKEQVVEEEAEEETQKLITWRPRMEDARSRKGQSSKDSSRKKGKAEWDD